MNLTETKGGWSHGWQGQLDGAGGLDATPRKKTAAERAADARAIEAEFEMFAAHDRALAVSR